MKERAQKVFIVIILLIFFGLLYGLFFMTTGIGIPCFFHKITGLYCPGCGVTHMCVSLMQGDIESAMRSNVMLFFLSPILLFIAGDYIIRYIKTGHWIVLQWQTVALYIMIALLVLFAIIRNIF